MDTNLLVAAHYRNAEKNHRNRGTEEDAYFREMAEPVENLVRVGRWSRRVAPRLAVLLVVLSPIAGIWE